MSDENEATKERVKLLTVHLPIDFGLFNDIMALLTRLYPSDANWADCQECNGDNIAFFAPPANQEDQG